MLVTKCSVRPEIKPQSRLRGYATVVLDGQLVIRYIRIIEGRDGLFIVFPSREKTRPCDKCGTKISFRDSHCRRCGNEVTAYIEEAEYKDIVFPINKELSKHISDRVLKEFEALASLSHVGRRK